MEYILSLSYGKDSLACLGAIEKLGWPLDRIVHAEVWATDTIPAELPPMVEFKEKADAIIENRWGIKVEHFSDDKTYEKVFYRSRTKSKIGNNGKIYGWPFKKGALCLSELKLKAIRKSMESIKSGTFYIGIAKDEKKRLERLQKNNKSPLSEIGWEEKDCFKWCKENNLLSPIYETSTRGGCWFCHNQSIGQLRLLRRNYPEYWNLMLKWDEASPVTFHADGHTVHDFERRFQMEDDGLIQPGAKFRWAMLDDKMLNYRIKGV